MQLWLERPVMATEGIVSLATILHHYETAWTRRHLPNVAAFHYADYQADVVGEMTRLAEVLAIDVTSSRVGELAEHATMGAMRAQAADLSPELWPSHESFFRAGGAREWRDIFTEAEHERYRQRSQELVAPEVLAWAHHGRQAADPDQ